MRAGRWVRIGCGALVGFALGVVLAQAFAAVTAPPSPGGPSWASVDVRP